MISAAYESCQCLQAGHWKSLAMTSQTLAAGSPLILAVSAIATRGSGVAESGVPGATAAASPSLTLAPEQAVSANTSTKAM
jgi:hypothetical protein